MNDTEKDWQPVDTMPKGAKVEGLLMNRNTIIGRTVPRSKFGDHNTVTDSEGYRHPVTHWRPVAAARNPRIKVAL